MQAECLHSICHVFRREWGQIIVTQLTLRGVDPALDARLRHEAERRGLSVNKTVLDLLRRATGLRDEKYEAVGEIRGPDGLFHDIDHLVGGWTKEEADEFDRELASMRQIDPEDWIEESESAPLRTSSRVTSPLRTGVRKSA